MVKKMASRMRAQMRHSFSTAVRAFARRAFPPSFRLSGWLLLDLVVVLGSLYGAIVIGSESGTAALSVLSPMTLAILLIGTAVIYSSQGLYRSVIRYMGQQAVWDGQSRLALDHDLGAAIFFTKTNLSGTAALVFWLLLLVGVGGLRLISRAWHQASVHADARRVIIYGAGIRGASYSTRSTTQLIIVLWLLSMTIPTCMRR